KGGTAPGSEPEAGAAGPERTAAGGKPRGPTRLVWGWFVVVALVVVRATLKVGTRRVLKAWDWSWVEALVMITLLLLAAAFLAWFGVVKVRQRRALGPPAAWAGAVELSALLAGVLTAAAVIADLIGALRQTGDAKALDAAAEAVQATWNPRYNV